jgi:dihydroorotate dehydrogenase (NAD+) catalytic subunit
VPADLRTRLGHVELPTPILTASGCAGVGRELAQFMDVARIGAVTTKSVTLEPRAGNPAPRLAETPSGFVSSVGLQGPGIDAFLQRDLPWLLSRGARAVVSIAGQTLRSYASLATRLSDAAGVTAIEINLGCPDAENGGQHFALDPAAAARVVAAVRSSARYDIPVFAKLSPNVADIVEVARACVAAGCDGLSLVNTLPGMVIDIGSRLAVPLASQSRLTSPLTGPLSGVQGGLSGPAIRPVAVRLVWLVHEALPDVPVIAAGGVAHGRDALEFLLAGASMVAVGTTLFHDPSACARIQRELEEELVVRGVDRIADVVGRAHQGSRLNVAT